jgi:hypothetical protein
MPLVFPRSVKRPTLWYVSLGRFLAPFAFLLIALVSVAQAVQSVTLSWDASPNSGITYRVYYPTTSGGSGPYLSVGNVTTATIPNLADSTTYYFSVTAYNATTGIESQHSNEVPYTTPGTLYTLTVVNGTGSGTYPYGAQVPVSANDPMAGQQFAGWSGDKDILANFMSANTTATIVRMQNLTITATYSDLPKYAVTVNNGTGDGSYWAGASVPIAADTAPSGQQFTGWTGNVTFASSSSPSTTFTMPASAVTVTATYSVMGTGTGLLGQYYNDGGNASYPLASPFTGSPVLTRTDATVDFNWGVGSPGSPVNSDNFSVRWTGQVQAPVSGSYTFTVTSDDGARLLINGVKVIDAWTDHGANSYSYTTNLTAGTFYNIDMQYYEHGGDALCRLHWSYPGQADQAIPQGLLSLPQQPQQQVAAPTFNPAPGTYSSTQSVTITSATAGASIRYTTDGSTPSSSVGTLYTGPVSVGSATLKAVAYRAGMTDSAVTSGTYAIQIGPGTGLLGRYYNDGSSASYPLANPFTGSPVLTRTDATVDFSWGGDSPGSPVSVDNFSARWTGQVKAPVSGSYTFTVTGDDGARLFLNGVKVIDGWKDQGATSYSYITNLTAGTSYSIELQYYEHNGQATCQLHWSYSTQVDQAIPQSQLSPTGQ